MISFVIPAHDEESLIGSAIDAIRAGARALGAEFEVVVAADACTDRTEEFARQHGARVVPVDLRQISRVRNAGAAAARGDVFVFVDADTVVSPGTLRGMMAALEAGAIGGGAWVRMDGRPGVTSRLILMLWNAGASWLGVAAGCFVFARRADFEAVGGFSEELFASEEIEISAALRQRGRFVVVREAVTTSGRKLRGHTPFEIAMPLLRYLLRGRRALMQREGLEMWYGPRRADAERRD